LAAADPSDRAAAVICTMDRTGRLRVRAGDLEGGGRNHPRAAEGAARSLGDARRDRL